MNFANIMLMRSHTTDFEIVIYIVFGIGSIIATIYSIWEWKFNNKGNYELALKVERVKNQDNTKTAIQLKKEAEEKWGTDQNDYERFLENFYASKVADGDSGAYIKNNTKAIEQIVHKTSPTFKGKQFIDFAQSVFSAACDENRRQQVWGTLLSRIIDLTQFPSEIVRFDICYLHNYIRDNDSESIKVFMSIDTNETLNKKEKEKYFVTFKRKNPLLCLEMGEKIKDICPHCGGEIEFKENELQSSCSYCGNTVVLAEYDWVLVKSERITDETPVINASFLKDRDLIK